MVERRNVNKKKRPKINPKGKLPVHVVTLSVCITLLGLLGLLSLSYYIEVIRNDYKRLVDNDYINLEYINRINCDIYKYHTLVFRYMTSIDDDGTSSNLEAEADILKSEIENTDKLLGENIIGTDYEDKYNDIHSKLNGYFDNVSYIYELNGSEDIKTASYDMEMQLSEYIDNVVTSVEEFSVMLNVDIQTAQTGLALRMTDYECGEWILIIILIIIGVIGYFRCIRITYDIINKDPLTKINDIGKLGKEMTKWLKKDKLKGYACICSNIKGLSLINRRYGANVGDKVLAKFATVMSQVVWKDERIARVGGDNFVYIVHGERVDAILKLLEKITVSVDVDDDVKVFDLENRCGIYMIGEDDNFGDILDAAYLSVHHAKKSSLPDNIWFDKELMLLTFERKSILSKYKRGIVEREFVVYYQPKVDMRKDTLCGSEALVRWQQEDSLVPPIKFIPLLEDDGSITELDFYVLDNVCRDIREWLDQGIKPVRVSSNFSKVHLRNSDFAEHVLEVINKYKIPHEYIEVELTESSGYENFNALISFVSVMNENNIYVSIDDFGTGYSSLSLLRELNVDVVKLDKSFIDEIGKGDVVNENLVKNVIHMIKDLDREIICEGVETKKQAQFLKENNCYKIQGYLYDKPLPHDEFEQRLKAPEYM